jgi:hypothetical protein
MEKRYLRELQHVPDLLEVMLQKIDASCDSFMNDLSKVVQKAVSRMVISMMSSKDEKRSLPLCRGRVTPPLSCIPL